MFLVSRKRTFAQRKKQLIRMPKTNRIVTRLVVLFLFSLSFFYSYDIFIAWMFIDTGITVFRRLRYRQVEHYKVLLVALLTPIFLFGFLLTEFDFTLVGLSKVNMVLSKKDGTIIKGKLVYKDDNMYYLEDTLKRNNLNTYSNLYPDTKRSIGISRDEIIQYRIDTVRTEIIKSKSLLDLIRQKEK
jgi:hypothetical protein